MPAPAPGSLPDVKLMVEALCGEDVTKAQNAAGVLAYFAISSTECRKAISLVDGVAEALARLIASENVDLQHNAALLLGQLATGPQFRRVFGEQPRALEVLVTRLLSEDPDIQCNVAWALRQLVIDSVHRETMIKARTAACLRPLLTSQDERVKTNAVELITVLRKPPNPKPEQSKASKEQGALVGLASLSAASGSKGFSQVSTGKAPGPDTQRKRAKAATPKGSTKKSKLQISTPEAGKSGQGDEESPRVESAEEGINALLSATMGVWSSRNGTKPGS
eukprot:TRINITY_DN996_c0_g1_i2.p1 TRINITY_DN996_c0_g1~~TRINITY_DN996_c0_g1_i2.p1  ORF type:complete len:279 (-),score=68.21 TRINITY_DN996_c0_g1_i2:230-1066(-)